MSDEEVVDLLSSAGEDEDDSEEQKENQSNSVAAEDISPSIIRNKSRKRKLIMSSSSSSESDQEDDKDEKPEQEDTDEVNDNVDKLSHRSQEDEDTEKSEDEDEEDQVNFTDEEIFNDDRMTVGGEDEESDEDDEEEENATEDDDEENLNVQPNIDDLINSIAIEVVETGSTSAIVPSNHTNGGPEIVEMFDSDNEEEEDAEDAERKAKRKLILEELKLLDFEESRLHEERSRIETMLANLRSSRDSLKRALASLRGDESKNKTWGSESFPHSRALRHNLKALFGFSEFRHLQLEVMNATMSRRDCFVVLPTGAGKSLLFQLPACVEGGITVVISPLLSLSRDQIMNLREKGIDATMISSEESPNEIKSAYARIFSADPSLRLVYVTPEMLVQSKKFVSSLESLNRRRMLTRIVLDEAHCCSTMGHDFRPDYQKLFFIKRQFPNVPLLCVTATATVEVEEDCRRVLMQEALDQQWLVFRTSSNRKNLVYHVMEKKASANSFHTQILQLIQSKFTGKSGIVYCFSRRDAEKAAEFLSKGGCPSRAYHAKLSPEEKRRTHEQWRLNKVRVVCATTAFGMGIDKPDVRFVIHSTLSGSVEGYAQESGRAGRDGQQADCVLLYRRADVTKVMQLTADKPNAADKVLEMAKYCENLSECRRVLLGRSFGEELKPESDPSKCCDVCSMLFSTPSSALMPTGSLMRREDFTAQAESVLRRFLELRSEGRATWKNVTFTQLVDAWKVDAKSSTNKKSLFHAPQEWSRSRCEQLAMYMLIERVFKVHFQYNSYSANVYIQEGERASVLLRQFQRKDVSIEFVYCLEGKKKQRTTSTNTDADGSSVKKTKQQQQQVTPKQQQPAKKRLKQDSGQVVDVLSDDSPQKPKSPGKKQTTTSMKKKSNATSVSSNFSSSKHSKEKITDITKVDGTTKKRTAKNQSTMTTTTTTATKKKTATANASVKKKQKEDEMTSSTLVRMFQKQASKKMSDSSNYVKSQNSQDVVMVLDGAGEEEHLGQQTNAAQMTIAASKKVPEVAEEDDDLWEDYPKSSILMNRKPVTNSGSVIGLRPTPFSSISPPHVVGTQVQSSNNVIAAWNTTSSSDVGKLSLSLGGMAPTSSFATPMPMRYANPAVGHQSSSDVAPSTTATASHDTVPQQPDFTVSKRPIQSLLDGSTMTKSTVLLAPTSTMAKRLGGSGGGGGGMNLLTQVARLPDDTRLAVASSSFSNNKERNGGSMFNTGYDDDEEDGFDPDEYYK